MNNNFDKLAVVTETKIGKCFPTNQLILESCHPPLRLNVSDKMVA